MAHTCSAICSPWMLVHLDLHLFLVLIFQPVTSVGSLGCGSEHMADWHVIDPAFASRLRGSDAVHMGIS